MTPYPLFYTPDGVTRPTCCPHQAPLACLPGKGPDAFTGADGSTQGGSGLCWGGPLPLPGSVRWTKSPAGWYVALDGMTPQALRRITTHPRVIRWATIPGSQPGHRWRVPVLISSDQDGDPMLAVDRVLTPQGFQAPDDLDQMIQSLLAVHAGRPLHEDPATRNVCCVNLALDLLALGQWIDRDLAMITGWITENLMVEVLRAAMNRTLDDDLVDPT